MKADRIVLVHGFTQTARSWRPTVARLTAALGPDVEIVALDAPGHGARADVRADLPTGATMLGVDGGRAQWLSGELDKAFVSGKKEEIEAVRNAIPQDHSGITQIMVRVAHQLSPLERLAAQRRFFESLDAAKAEEARKAEATRPEGVRKARPPKAQ